MRSTLDLWNISYPGKPCAYPVVVMLSQASVVHVMGVVNSFCFLGHLFEVFQSEESCEARRLTKTKKTCATLWFWGSWGSLAPLLVGIYIIPGLRSCPLNSSRNIYIIPGSLAPPFFCVRVVDHHPPNHPSLNIHRSCFFLHERHPPFLGGKGYSLTLHQTGGQQKSWKTWKLVPTSLQKTDREFVPGKKNTSLGMHQILGKSMEDVWVHQPLFFCQKPFIFFHTPQPKHMHNFVARKSRGNWRISHCTLSYLMQGHSLACCSLCSKSAEGHNAEGFLVWKPALLQTWREISWMMLEQIKQHSGILHDDSHYHLWIYHLPRASWDLGTIPIKATMKVLWKNIWNKSPTKATFILTWKTYRILQCFSGFWWHNIVTFQTCYLEDHPT